MVDIALAQIAHVCVRYVRATRGDQSVAAAEARAKRPHVRGRLPVQSCGPSHEVRSYPAIASFASLASLDSADQSSLMRDGAVWSRVL